MSAVARVNIKGVSVESVVDCSEGDSTELVYIDLQRGFGNGILKYEGRLFVRPSLVAGVYEYYVTAPAGGQPSLATGAQPAGNYINCIRRNSLNICTLIELFN